MENRSLSWKDGGSLLKIEIQAEQIHTWNASICVLESVYSVLTVHHLHEVIQAPLSSGRRIRKCMNVFVHSLIFHIMQSVQLAGLSWCFWGPEHKLSMVHVIGYISYRHWDAGEGDSGGFSTISVCINEQYTLKQLCELPIVSVSFKKVICYGRWCAHHAPAPLPSVGSIFPSHTLMFPSGDLNNKAKQNWAGEEASAPENSVFVFFSVNLQKWLACTLPNLRIHLKHWIHFQPWHTDVSFPKTAKEIILYATSNGFKSVWKLWLFSQHSREIGGHGEVIMESLCAI